MTDELRALIMKHRLMAVGPSTWDIASARWQSEALQRLTACLLAGVVGGLGAYVEAAKRAGITPLQPLGKLQPEEKYSLMETIHVLSAPISDTATLKNRGREAMDMRPLFSRLAEWALCTYSCDALAMRLQYQDLKNLTDAWDTTARNARQFKFTSYVVTSIITACQSAYDPEKGGYDDSDGDPSECLAYLEDDAARKALESALRREWHALHNSKYEHTSHLANKRAVAMQKENARLHRVPSKRRR